MPQTESPNFRPLLALGPKFGLGQVNLFLKQAIIKVWGGGQKDTCFIFRIHFNVLFENRTKRKMPKRLSPIA